MSYFSPETISRIARLQVRAHHVVDGFLSGQHNSPFTGSSIEFRQHREYAPGDDLRNLDWKVLAKQDRYYIKQYESQTNMNSALLVDASRSMNYRGPNAAMSKFDYAATCAVCVAYLLLRQQDFVGCLKFDSSVLNSVPQKSHRAHLDDVARCLETGGLGDKTDLQPIFSTAMQRFARRGLFVLFSDLLAPRDGLRNGLKLLRGAGNEVLVIHILDDDELDFDFSGPTKFNDLESDTILRCNPRGLKAGYLEQIHAYLEEVGQICSEYRVKYQLVRTSTPLDAALTVAFQT